MNQYKLYLAPDSPNVLMYTAGVDYVRLTHKKGGDYEAAARLYQSAAYAVLAQLSEGEIWFEPWAWQGYYGARGGPVSYGTGNEGCILQVSGPGADSVLQYSLPYDNVARVDVQYTVWLETDEIDTANRCARYSLDARNMAHGGRWAVDTRETYGNGNTTYIGSRGSPRFARIYDKGRQGGEDSPYRQAWRFELEYSDEAARALWPDKSPYAPGSEYWAGVVCAELRTRGIPLRRPPDAARVAPIRLERPESSAEKRLAWLRSQVAPSIAKLEAAGVKRATIMEALGWGDYNVR